MFGGDGADVFVMASGTASSYGTDSINGGNGFDMLDFSGARSAVVRVARHSPALGARSSETRTCRRRILADRNKWGQINRKSNRAAA
jgi:hypothetical protein